MLCWDGEGREGGSGGGEGTVGAHEIFFSAHPQARGVLGVRGPVVVAHWGVMCAAAIASASGSGVAQQRLVRAFFLGRCVCAGHLEQTGRLGAPHVWCLPFSRINACFTDDGAGFVEFSFISRVAGFSVSLYRRVVSLEAEKGGRKVISDGEAVVLCCPVV